LTVSIVLSSPGNGAVLASPATATFVIRNGNQTGSLPAPVTINRVQPVMNANGQVFEILVGFSGGVNAAQARKTSTYRLTLAGTGGSFTARTATVIKLRSAVYRRTKDTVALIPRAPFALGKPVQLVVVGVGAAGLHDSDGRLIDGNDDGQPGSNAVVVLRRSGLSINGNSKETVRRDALRSSC
jgi:hypothetical protein